jgi:hypothetical protein
MLQNSGKMWSKGFFFSQSRNLMDKLYSFSFLKLQSLDGVQTISWLNLSSLLVLFEWLTLKVILETPLVSTDYVCQCSGNFILHTICFMFYVAVSCETRVGMDTILTYLVVNYILILATIVLVTLVIIIIIQKWLRGIVVVKVVCYRPKGRGFQTRWG